jgi:hypothetical protein
MRSVGKRTIHKGHDRVCAQLHRNLRREIGVILDYEQCYDHVPKSVRTSREGLVTILRNQQVQTDSTSPNIKPDSIIRNDEKRTCVLIGTEI